MSGRRYHARFAVRPSPEGVVRVPRDVMVQTDGGSDVVVISPLPGVIGEVLILELSNGTHGASLRVQVAASGPIVVGSVVRHRLRLRIITPAPPDGSDRDGAAEATTPKAPAGRDHV